jgi:cyclophilin family peptidyl-prolyl cis-trans isomerase
MPAARALLLSCAFASAGVVALRALSAFTVDASRVAAAGDDDANPAYDEALRHPCSPEMNRRAPETFAALFSTNFGPFTATCVRARAPVQVDRVFNAISHGYYDANFFFRVLHTATLNISQFGTAGRPAVSNVYNYSSTPEGKCAVLQPQPPAMPVCMTGRCSSPACAGVKCLSNTLGTLSMSTSMEITKEYTEGVTWNATAELFINTGDNSRLDKYLFVPICLIDEAGMNSVLNFPSFGEVAELGGPGPSLGLLYQDGNRYIRANAAWDGMAITRRVQLVA